MTTGSKWWIFGLILGILFGFIFGFGMMFLAGVGK